MKTANWSRSENKETSYNERKNKEKKIKKRRFDSFPYVKSHQFL